MKLISHLLILLVGAGIGIWWGVNHPSEAQNIHDQEEIQAAKVQAAVSQEKIDLMNRLLGQDSVKPADTAAFKQMISDEKQKLQDAKSKLPN
ncbi:MAG TPA: hypothetical protein VGG44_02565 [Tepidisphaeraceae bacterium]|jgi:hypothetical protein